MKNYIYICVYVCFIGVDSLTDTIDKENIHAEFISKGNIIFNGRDT